jgi:hypothetical protein
VIDYLADRFKGQSVGVAYTYFDYGNQTQQSALNIVASLARQLASHVDNVIPDLYSIYKTLHSKGQSPDRADLFQALVMASKELRTSFIILDALDECESEQRWILLELISQLPGSDFKVFTTSRPYLRDVEKFLGCNPMIEIVANYEDLRAYMTKRVNHEVAGSPGLKSEIIETLSVSANGLYADCGKLANRQRFLLGKDQLNYVLQFKNPKNMRKALKHSVPTEFFELYEHVMVEFSRQTDDCQETVGSILSWIYYSKRPLKMEELREALLMQDGDENLEPDDLMSPEGIVELCRSFVTHEKESDIVRFSHEKVREFIQERHEHKLSPEKYLAATCINFLLLDEFSVGATADEKSFRNRLERHPFVLYAAVYWSAHLKSAKAELDEGIRRRLVQLCGSSGKIDSLFQMERANSAMAWEQAQKSWRRGASLLHLLIDTGLSELARLLLAKPELFSVS